MRPINWFMRAIFSEKNLVIVLFVMVFIIFSLAQEDSKKKDQFYVNGIPSITISPTTFLNSSVYKPGVGEKAVSIFSTQR